jgi:hypothetical protein
MVNGSGSCLIRFTGRPVERTSQMPTYRKLIAQADSAGRAAHITLTLSQNHEGAYPRGDSRLREPIP